MATFKSTAQAFRRAGDRKIARAQAKRKALEKEFDDAEKRRKDQVREAATLRKEERAIKGLQLRIESANRQRKAASFAQNKENRAASSEQRKIRREAASRRKEGRDVERLGLSKSATVTRKTKAKKDAEIATNRRRGSTIRTLQQIVERQREQIPLSPAQITFAKQSGQAVGGNIDRAEQLKNELTATIAGSEFTADPVVQRVLSQLLGGPRINFAANAPETNDPLTTRVQRAGELNRAATLPEIPQASLIEQLIEKLSSVSSPFSSNDQAVPQFSAPGEQQLQPTLSPIQKRQQDLDRLLNGG